LTFLTLQGEEGILKELQLAGFHGFWRSSTLLKYNFKVDGAKEVDERIQGGLMSGARERKGSSNPNMYTKKGVLKQSDAKAFNLIGSKPLGLIMYSSEDTSSRY
ncbi:hypothetical protein SDJN02_10683, partial [Cucurbita argyrosperma subsp. argyrosperma]